MTAQPQIVVQQIVPRNGVVVLSGYGVRVAVERGHLVVCDGIGRERREARLARATSKLRRLVVLGHSGTVSLEALRWLADVKGAFVHIDADGEVIAATAPLGLDDPRLRRAQALATTNGIGLEIARTLIGLKLRGQAEVLDQLPDSEHARGVVEDYRRMLAEAETAEQLRLLEANAAVAYWQTWAPLAIPWVKKDAARVPAHWQTFGSRSSPLSGASRNAASPANAMLNYLYAILEAECRIALLSIGLDPGLGVMHADQRGRDSLALDLMEAMRPNVDRFVLGLLQSHTFTAKDFFETRQGICRVLPPLTHQLAESAGEWTRLVAPHVETIARACMGSTKSGSGPGPTVPTLLTQANRSAGRPSNRASKSDAGKATTHRLAAACQECGTVLEDRSRKYCDVCAPERQVESLAIFAKAGPARLAQLRAEGNDPTKTEAARAKQGQRNRESYRANAEWDQAHAGEVTTVDFAQDILPGLQGVALSTIMRATGLSLRYCSLIRQGQKVPHQRHWAALGAVIEVARDGET
ncbi:MAG: CRISPR-associated endonuclease Cas1 [Fimbriimonadaceae bacterium]|nr:CRISPR-associated endonuclease Cas1 [Fimbriimonadaceae bacterium]